MNEFDLDDRALLRHLHAEHAIPDDLAIARARSVVLSGGRRAPRREWRRPVLQVGVAAVATTGILGGLLVGQAYGPAAETATAGELLERAAVSARSTPAPVPAPGQYLYRQIVSRELVGSLTPGGGWVACASVVEDWTAAGGGTPALLRRIGGITLKSAIADPGHPVADPACRLQEYTTKDSKSNHPLGTWDSPDAAFLAGLPDDPSTFLTRARDEVAREDRELRELGNPPVADLDGAVLNRLVDLANETVGRLTPAQQAALFDAIGQVPGVRLGAEGDTLLGRRGQVVTRTSDDGRDRIDFVLDAAAGTVLGRREVTLTNGVPAGTPFYESAVRTDVVGSPGDRPTG